MLVLMLDNFRGWETGETLWQPGETHDTSEDTAAMLVRDGKAVLVVTDERPADDPPKKSRKAKAAPDGSAPPETGAGEEPSTPEGAYAKPEAE